MRIFFFSGDQFSKSDLIVVPVVFMNCNLVEEGLPG